MPAPTKVALERKPQAVIIQQFVATHPDVVHTLDFEWFETDEGRSQYFDEVSVWMEEDVKQNGDILYTVTEVTDTSAMTLARSNAFGPDEQWKGNAVQAITLDTLIMPPAKKATAKKPAAKKGAVRPRKASAAAAVVKGTTEDNTPAVKSKTVRAKKAAPKAEAAAPAASTAGSDKRAAALKARLAAKQADGGVVDVAPSKEPAKRTATKKVAAAPKGPQKD